MCVRAATAFIMQARSAKGEMTMKDNSHSEFCQVDYVKSDNVVLLSWKKFARLDDYREPTLFALNLLRQHPQSNFVVDARNGKEASG